MKVRLKVNGEGKALNVPSRERLIFTIRERLGLTGAKIGCGKGECGACTVLVDGEPVLSCLILTGQVDGSDVVTVEGLTHTEVMRRLERSFVERGAVQCGFCIPGIIVSSSSLLMRNPSPSDEDIKVALSGNLCRCTGYVKIIEAVKGAVESGCPERG